MEVMCRKPEVMALRVFNSLTLKKQIFKPEGKPVKILLCGPTTYDHCHLGHARTFVAFDTIARYLKYRGYKTKVVMNVTDIHRDISRNAEKAGQSSKDYADRYFRSFLDDLRMLGIDTIDTVTRASHNLPEMMAWIAKLLEKKAAYVTEEGVYLDTRKVKGYGALSHQSRSQLALRRLNLSPLKKHQEDFPVWCNLQEERDVWDSPWGRGRPGEHIEDAAASTKYLGLSYDINGGGDELIFPHHEAIKAQVEAVTKASACKYWLHTGLMYVRGRKMSKSLHNFITIREALDQYDPRVVRLYFSLTHYRKPLHFKRSDLERASRFFGRLSSRMDELKSEAKQWSEEGNASNLDAMTSTFKRSFVEAMDNDFDTETAAMLIVDFSKSLMKASRLRKQSRRSLSEATQFLAEACSILGIL
jgi:cysteinyl-tRNA synthetase